MKYPYICKCSDGDIVFLVVGKDLGVVLEDSKKILVEESKEKYKNTYTEDDNGNLERGITNITREYLTNTYGKVESKEHAEFNYWRYENER